MKQMDEFAHSLDLFNDARFNEQLNPNYAALLPAQD
jgi:hypothetical protein